jgi:hypothetical protein
VKAPHTLNPLGSLPAEHDHSMLEAAFFETPDYKTLLENNSFQLVVGRRGAGKSALFYRLAKQWNNIDHLRLITLGFEQTDFFGIRDALNAFQTRPQLSHAAAKLVWTYSLLLEAALPLVGYYKFAKFEGEDLLRTEASKWRASGTNLAERLRKSILLRTQANGTAEARIADLASNLKIRELQAALTNGLSKCNERVNILIDRLDEGFEPDAVGIGILVGLVNAAADINHRFTDRIRLTLFLRDNMFRAVAKEDANFTRTIEGHVLRLHWDEDTLLGMVANRLRVAFNSPHENSIRVWNDCTARELVGKEGFRRCLKQTLYRPRDLLSLLNQAFHYASRQSRACIVQTDVEEVARDISRNRLADLIKEYETIFPGLEHVLPRFHRSSPHLTYRQTIELLDSAIESTEFSPLARQHNAILGSSQEYLRGLHSIGFIGIQDPISTTYIFCHDGKNDQLSPQPESKLLIHPCYWLALDCQEQALLPVEASEINDEYDIKVSSQTPEIRKRRISELVTRLDRIPLGPDGASSFEEWCFDAVKLAFAKGLTNAIRHPNPNGTQRRDIVASNSGLTPTWQRIITDYEARQVVFEVKNFDHQLAEDNFRQALSYTGTVYGKIVFIITRAQRHELMTSEDGADREADWVRELYTLHDALIIKLTGNWFRTNLSKLRSPTKHDYADAALGQVIDMYERTYVHVQRAKVRKSSK